jgi:hypothetical protein
MRGESSEARRSRLQRREGKAAECRRTSKSPAMQGSEQKRRHLGEDNARRVKQSVEAMIRPAERQSGVEFG